MKQKNLLKVYESFFGDQTSAEDVSSGEGLRKDIEFSGLDYKENNFITFQAMYENAGRNRPNYCLKIIGNLPGRLLSVEFLKEGRWVAAESWKVIWVYDIDCKFKNDPMLIRNVKVRFAAGQPEETRKFLYSRPVLTVRCVIDGTHATDLDYMFYSTEVKKIFSITFPDKKIKTVNYMLASGDSVKISPEIFREIDSKVNKNTGDVYAGSTSVFIDPNLKPLPD